MLTCYDFSQNFGDTTFLTRFSSSPPVDEVSSASGTLSGNASCDTTNKRLNLDGTGDRCRFAGGDVNTSVGVGWTIEAHVSVVSGTNNGTIAARSAASTGGWWFAYALNPPGSPVRACEFYAYEWDGLVLPLLQANNAFPDATERHVAVVRDGTTWRMYVDGVQSSTATWSGAPTNSTLPLDIGMFDATADTDLQGTIGRVKVSNFCRYPGGTTFTPPSRTDA